MSKPFKSFNEVVEYASTYQGETEQIDVEIPLVVNDKSYMCYEVAVCSGQVTAYFNDGYAEYDINNVSGEYVAVLHDYFIIR